MAGGAAGSTPRTAAALAFVDDLEAPTLTEADAHHLRRVLRLPDGAGVAVADGRGRWRRCTLAGGRLVPEGDTVADDPLTPQITVGFSIPKTEKPELVVQKLTELGVDRIVLLRAERSVVRWEGDRAARHLARLHRVAREAAMQARRVRLPEVTGPVDVEVAAGWPGAALCEPGGAAPGLDRTVLLVGPEGGWTESELGVGAPTIDLAPYVLRVETAAIAAGTLLGALRSRIVMARPPSATSALSG